jgi:hypothetical protein
LSGGAHGQSRVATGVPAARRLQLTPGAFQ